MYSDTATTEGVHYCIVTQVWRLSLAYSDTATEGVQYSDAGVEAHLSPIFLEPVRELACKSNTSTTTRRDNDKLHTYFPYILYKELVHTYCSS